MLELRKHQKKRLKRKKFSGAEHTMSDQRNGLKSEMIVVLWCLKSWFRLGIFAKEDLSTIVDQLEDDGPLEVLEED